MGKKLSAVSHKVNTTRLEIVGIRNIQNTQIIYHDTPGILQKRFNLIKNLICSESSREEKELTDIAKQALKTVDAFITVSISIVVIMRLSMLPSHLLTSPKR